MAIVHKNLFLVSLLICTCIPTFATNGIVIDSAIYTCMDKAAVDVTDKILEICPSTSQTCEVSGSPRVNRLTKKYSSCMYELTVSYHCEQDTSKSYTASFDEKGRATLSCTTGSYLNPGSPWWRNIINNFVTLDDEDAQSKKE